MKIILIDHDAPWVRSLFAAMYGQAEVFALYPHIPFSARHSNIKLWSWQQVSPGFWEKPILFPGFRKYPRLSSTLIRRAIRKAIARWGKPDLVVYTLPFYAPVAAALHGKFPQVYQAHDVFRFYDWNPIVTTQLELQMLHSCDAIFSVARALTEDFRKISSTPVFDCPMAVSSSFVTKLQSGNSCPVPDDLQSLPRPIIGCVGQINRSYDWKMISALADALPSFTFAFIGPIFDESPDLRLLTEQAMNRTNIKWLGKKPHKDLPAYLSNFDICLNPLAINEHNDRRSPLRLYDYLATNKPIASTAIREAFTHEGLVETFSTAEEGVALLRRMISTDYKVDQAARAAYINKNTWESRAAQFLTDVSKIK